MTPSCKNRRRNVSYRFVYNDKQFGIHRIFIQRIYYQHLEGKSHGGRRPRRLSIQYLSSPPTSEGHNGARQTASLSQRQSRELLETDHDRLYKAIVGHHDSESYKYDAETSLDKRMLHNVLSKSVGSRVRLSKVVL